MRQDFIPAKESELDTFALNFSTLLTANFADYGLLTGDASGFATLYSDWNAAYLAASNPSTSTRSTVATKNTAKVAMIAKIRQLARTAQAYGAMDDSMRRDLGLTVRNVIPTPIADPLTSPIVSVSPAGASRLNVRIADAATPTKLAKPFGVRACELYYKVHPAVPTGPADGIYLGSIGKGKTQVTLPSALNGEQINVIGRWVSTRNAPGPISAVATATLAA